jgi:CheY-like chemotaxis protein
MDKTVLIAIISAVASLIVATISLIAVLLNGKNTSRTSESIERLKNEFIQNNRSKDILTSELIETLQNLKVSTQAIQSLRNEIQRFKYDKEIAVKTGVFEKIRDATTSVIDSYSISHTSLSQTEKAVFHSSKNIAIDCQMTAERVLNNMKKNKKSNIPEIDSDIYEKFDYLQIRLSEAQTILRECRAERLLELSQVSLTRTDKVKKKIIWIDDEPRILNSFFEEIRLSLDVQVDFYSGVESAIYLLQNNYYDLIITDVMMPYNGGDLDYSLEEDGLRLGWFLTKKIRSGAWDNKNNHFALSKTPVIIFSDIMNNSIFTEIEKDSRTMLAQKSDYLPDEFTELVSSVLFEKI